MTFEMKFSQIDNCFRPKFENFVELGDPTLIEGNFTENGDYNAKDEGANGYSKVTVNVEPPLQDKTVTENGTYKADEGFYGLGEVAVNVPSRYDEGYENGYDKGYEEGVENAPPTADPNYTGFIEGTNTELYNEAATKVGAKAFYQNKKITSVGFPNVTVAEAEAFYQCSTILSARLDNVKQIGANCFRECSNLEEIFAPKLESIAAAGLNSTALKKVYFPFFSNTTGTNAFNGCKSLQSAVLGACTSLRNYSFGNCYSLTACILGDTTKVAELQGTTVFNVCYHILGTVNATYNPNGAKDGYIYVPLSLVADYRVATNWATFASQIMPFVSTVEGLTDIDGTTYDHACVWSGGEDFTEYYFNGTAWEVFTR